MKKLYFGIIDAYGIESVFRYDKEQKQEMEKKLKLLELRATFNPQRNAIVYKIELIKDEIEKIRSCIKKQKFIRAGNILTKKIDERDGTKYTEINKGLLKLHKKQGYL